MTCTEPARLHIKTAANVHAAGSFILPQVSGFNSLHAVNLYSESEVHRTKEYVLSDYERPNLDVIHCVAQESINEQRSQLDQVGMTMLESVHEMRLDSTAQENMLTLLSVRLDEVVIINDQRKVHC